MGYFTEYYPELNKELQKALHYEVELPEHCVRQLGILAEYLACHVLDRYNLLEYDTDNIQAARIDILWRHGLLPDDIRDKMNRLRFKRNKMSHNFLSERAAGYINDMEYIIRWFEHVMQNQIQPQYRSEPVMQGSIAHTPGYWVLLFILGSPVVYFSTVLIRAAGNMFMEWFEENRILISFVTLLILAGFVAWVCRYHASKGKWPKMI